MVDLIILQKLGIALAIGLMIGFEREIAQERHTNVKFAGLRTFGLAGLIGGISAFLATNNPMILVAALLAMMALLAIAYFRSTGMQPHLGFTTEISLILAFMLGALAYYEMTIAVILAVIVTILLAFKQPLHDFTHQIPKTEFYDSLLFALIAIVILPILPDHYYGLPQFGLPELINPYQTWLFVVFISGISFVGYFLVKWFGPTAGLAMTGIVGGLASSTAVTTTMGANTRESPGLEAEAMTAATLANTVMLLRVLFIVLIFYPVLLLRIYLPFGAMFVMGILVAIYFYFQSTRIPHKGKQIKLHSPFSIKPALTFAAMITVILFVSRVASTYFGSYGLYITSIFAGLAAVDAIAISASQLAFNGAIIADVAAVAILLAVIVNLGIRVLYAFYFGTSKFGMYTVIMASLMVGAGGLVALLVL